ncbi:Hypothetical protein, putative [Bodo saltans]|uniref:VWFA domain-containing protein n=1 Tax=Bodo saltans TaxID=75058 RepID=A0A0S4JAH4_BODSA|nr:Hypothetical protein, putative [Bodo saltans]|eukprot:CUG87338.1 Hypothetical protein, putative [Bodo saltans]
MNFMSPETAIVPVVLAVVCYLVYRWLNPLSLDYRSSALYDRKYAHTRVAMQLPTHSEAQGASQGMPQCKFFLSAKAQLQRSYILLVDRSGSMSTSHRWDEACAAARFLAPYICKFDPVGITLMFFDHDIEKFEGIKTKEEVEEAFSRFKPRGSTDLAQALHSAFLDHFNGTYGSTTILVITDGCPNSQSEVERIVRRGANSIENLGELSVSFIQIGDDRNATKFLNRIDHSLVNAKYDIVDAVTAEECARISFSELVARSIFD